MSVSIADLRVAQSPAGIICVGSHRGIIQSILDFDYLCGKPVPSVHWIVASGRKTERYFYGKDEVILPVKQSLEDLSADERQSVMFAINLSSGRRVLETTIELISTLPNLQIVNLFAERVPEKHAIGLKVFADARGVRVVGGSSVGLVVPGYLKLGAIGGTQASQIELSALTQSDGLMAVVSTSGGMVNEIIRTVARSGYGLSFALALGGERFPATTAEEALLLAQQDGATKSIAYFGELGGDDEYRIAEMVQNGTVTKPIIAYVAGSVAELFAEPPQFGHAKAMASKDRETARAKTGALTKAGVSAHSTYAGFVKAINNQPGFEKHTYDPTETLGLIDRRSRQFASTLSADRGGTVQILGQDLLDFTQKHSFAYITAAMLLGKSTVSPELEAFVDFSLRLLVDHGPHVSGAVNTMIAARAGKDLVSSLAAGLLTVGPRFGGALNEAAGIWLKGVEGKVEPAKLVEDYARRKQYLLGIGHKKYSTDNPDPRVAAAIQFSQSDDPFIKFALGVQAETTKKKGNLILNVDGAIAAILLDILYNHEGYSFRELHDLIDAEFFNALFVLSRSVGFMAHYFDQRRLDEGLFRLKDDDVLTP